MSTFFSFFHCLLERENKQKKSKSFSGKSFPFLANHFFVLLLNALSKAMELFARTQTIVVPTNKWTLKEEKLKTGFAQKKWAYPDTDKQEPSEEKKNAFCKTELAAKRFFFFSERQQCFKREVLFFFFDIFLKSTIEANTKRQLSSFFLLLCWNKNKTINRGVKFLTTFLLWF